MQAAAEMLAEFGVPHECRVVSAHRTPDWMVDYAAQAEARGLEVIIAGAGGAAHLPGVPAGHTLRPGIGAPRQSRARKGRRKYWVSFMVSVLHFVLPKSIVGTVAGVRAKIMTGGGGGVPDVQGGFVVLVRVLRTVGFFPTARVRFSVGGGLVGLPAPGGGALVAVPISLPRSSPRAPRLPRGKASPRPRAPPPHPLRAWPLRAAG